MSLHVRILGSGTIIPAPGRRATSIVIVRDDEPYLFDCGPGALDALEELGISFRTLKRIFLTHYHADHTLGLGHLLCALHIDDETDGTEPLTIYGPINLDDFIDRWHALFRSTMPKGRPPDLVEVSGAEVYRDGGVQVRAAAADHNGEPAISYRFEAEGKSVVITGDTSYSGAVMELSRGADLLIAECSTPDAREIPGHMTPSAVGRLATNAGVKRAVLVHMYPFFGEDDPAAPVREIFEGTVKVAGDGMKIDL